VLERSLIDKHHTFEQRMNIIVGVAKKCRNRVGEILCGGAIEEYLLMPSKLIDQTTANRENNTKRQKFIEKGRPDEPDSQRSEGKQ
jgi:hypothetical protein